MICYPNAKINIGLKIISKRKDGFHNLSSFFHPIPLCDVLEVNIDNKLISSKITYSGIIFPNPKDDLVLKVYNLLRKDFILPSLRIHLHKNIPYGSGLGGGSSDATHMLILLNKMFDLKLKHDDLIKYAVSIGSDCSFFLYNSCSYISGVGNNIKPVQFNLQGYYIVILQPQCSLSTAEVFAKYQIKKNVQSLSNYNWKDGFTHFVNDLETVSFNLCPELKKCQSQLKKMGAEYISMSGSGSAIYGLFKNKPVLENNLNCWFWEGFL